MYDVKQSYVSHVTLQPEPVIITSSAGYSYMTVMLTVSSGQPGSPARSLHNCQIGAIALVSYLTKLELMISFLVGKGP